MRVSSPFPSHTTANMSSFTSYRGVPDDSVNINWKINTDHVKKRNDENVISGIKFVGSCVLICYPLVPTALNMSSFDTID